jgi:hypothetical protein
MWDPLSLDSFSVSSSFSPPPCQLSGQGDSLSSAKINDALDQGWAGGSEEINPVRAEHSCALCHREAPWCS